jgi:hypothetical protein
MVGMGLIVTRNDHHIGPLAVPFDNDFTQFEIAYRLVGSIRQASLQVSGIDHPETDQPAAVGAAEAFT